MSVHWPILRRLATHPRSVVLTDDQRRWRAAELLIGAFHVADEIERRSRSQTVGLLLPTSGLFPMAALASWMLGRTVVPLNYLLSREELQYVVDDCETDTIIGAGPMLAHLGHTPRVANLIKVDEIDFSGLPDVRWPTSASADDLATLLYTSGTSGRPKGVMLTHGNILANIAQARRLAHITRADTFLGVLPQFHSFGFTVLTLLPLTIGAGAVFTARFAPRRIIDLIRTHHATIFIAIPSMYNALLHAKSGGPEDLASLRFAVSGGEPLPDAVAREFFEKFSVRINEGYGLTETSPVTNICLPEDFRPHSVGKPVEWLEQAIVDPGTGRRMEPPHEGEIRMRGPNVMRGYFRLPQETGQAFDERGYFRTGDIGRFDDEGHLYITGRLKEMIIIGGENVFPREIEEVLNAHPDVAASGVIGVQDPVRGELPVAFVEMREGATFDETALRTWCRERLANYKVPREIRVVRALPRNPTGKIMRRELRGLVGERAGES